MSYQQQQRFIRGLVLGMLGASVIVACTSVRNGKLGPNSGKDSNEPFVEGYLEYPGPRQAWGGPQTASFHVTAKDGEKPRLWVSPASLAPFGTATAPAPQANEARAPASQLSHQPDASAQGYPVAMTLDAVREELADITEEFYDGDSNVAGCQYPVRLRLVRSGGGVVEREGCRGIGTWTRAASETVSRFLFAANEAARGPASVKSAITTSLPTETKAATEAHATKHEPSHEVEDDDKN